MGSFNALYAAFSSAVCSTARCVGAHESHTVVAVLVVSGDVTTRTYSGCAAVGVAFCGFARCKVCTEIRHN